MWDHSGDSLITPNAESGDRGLVAGHWRARDGGARGFDPLVTPGPATLTYTSVLRIQFTESQLSMLSIYLWKSVAI